MTESVCGTIPVQYQIGSGSPLSGSGSQFSAELTGFAGWINRPWAFRIALGLIALVYLASITPRWYPTSDSALYLMLGDNLAAGQGYTLWGKPHIHVPPGFPLLLAGLKSIGIESFLGLNCVMTLLALGTLVCSYFALRELVTPPFAKWLICLVGFCHVTHHTSICLLSDIPFMGLIWLGFLLHLRGLRTGEFTLEIGTFLLLASCLLRIVGAPIALGAALGLLLQTSPQVSRNRLWLNACGTVSSMLLVCVIAASFAFVKDNSHALPSYLDELTHSFSSVSLATLTQPLVNCLKTSPELATLLTGQKHPALGLFIAFLWAPILIGATLCWKRDQKYGVCVLGCYLFILLMLRPMVARYLLPMAPLLFWYFLEGLRWMCDRTWQWQRRGRRAVGIATIVLLALSLPKAGKLAYHAHHPQMDSSYATNQAVQDVARFLKENMQPGERFGTNEDERQLAYLSGTWSLPGLERKLARLPPNIETLNAAVKESLRYVIVGPSRYRKQRRLLVSFMRDLPGVLPVHSNHHFQVYQIIPGRFQDTDFKQDRFMIRHQAKHTLQDSLFTRTFESINKN